MTTILIIYIITGLVLMAAAVPLWLGKIPPNLIYGVRLPATLQNPDLWYKANAYGGKLIFICGVVQTIFSVGLYFVPHLRIEKYTLSCAGICTGSLLYALSLIMRFIDSNL